MIPLFRGFQINGRAKPVNTQLEINVKCVLLKKKELHTKGHRRKMGDIQLHLRRESWLQGRDISRKVGPCHLTHFG